MSVSYDALVAGLGAVTRWRLDEPSGTTVVDSVGSQDGVIDTPGGSGTITQGVAGIGGSGDALDLHATGSNDPRVKSATFPAAWRVDTTGEITWLWWYKGTVLEASDMARSVGGAGDISASVDAAGLLTVGYFGSLATTVNVVDGVWHMIALTAKRDAGSSTYRRTVYVDGVSVASSTASFTPGGSPWEFWLGGNGSPANGRPGVYTEFTVFDTELSGSDMADLWFAGGHRVRFRRNFASGELDAGVVAADTVLTSTGFAALPEVQSGEGVLALTVDPAGSTPEVVYVTAHAAGAQTVTVERGRETREGAGPAAVWAAGTVWQHGPTAVDFAGVDSAVQLRDLAAVASTGDYGDLRGTPGDGVEDQKSFVGSSTLQFAHEFATDSVGGLPAGLTWVNQAGSTFSAAFGVAKLATPARGSYSFQMSLVVNTVPTPATWTVTAAMSGALARSNEFTMYGLALYDSTLGDTIAIRNSSDSGLIVTRWTDTAGGGGSNVKTGIALTPTSGFYRWAKTAATTYACSFSDDGRAWTPIHTIDLAGILTPSHVGLIVGSGMFGSGSTPPMEVSCRWIRGVS